MVFTMGVFFISTEGGTALQTKRRYDLFTICEEMDIQLCERDGYNGVSIYEHFGQNI